VEKLYELRRRLAANTNQTYYGRWARWFFAPGAARTISPASDVTVPEYVRRRIEENTLESLEEGTSLSPTNALAFSLRALTLASRTYSRVPQSSPPVDPLPSADWFSRYATNLAPTDPIVGLIQQSIAQRIPPGILLLPPAYKRWDP
jgi:hypothetical protein